MNERSTRNALVYCISQKLTIPFPKERMIRGPSKLWLEVEAPSCLWRAVEATIALDLTFDVIVAVMQDPSRW